MYLLNILVFQYVSYLRFAIICPYMTKIREELGNMLIVESDDGVEQVPKTEKNILLYKHDLKDLFNNENIVRYDNNTDSVNIKMKKDTGIYEISVNGKYPVVNDHSQSSEVLKGIRDIEEDNDYTRIKRVYDKIYEKGVRIKIMNKTVGMFNNKVIPESDGWNILGMFKLTWTGDVLLHNNNDKVYKVRGNSVEEMEEKFHFLDLDVGDIEQGKNIKIQVNKSIDESEFEKSKEEIDCPMCEDTNEGFIYSNEMYDAFHNCPDCDIFWKEYNLKKDEVEFLTKTHWLINYRDKLDDDAFWDVIESYIRDS